VKVGTINLYKTIDDTVSKIFRSMDFKEGRIRSDKSPYSYAYDVLYK
jgi:hypothetical protein